MKYLHPLLLLMLSMGVTNTCQAQITEFRWDVVDNSSGGPQLDGFITADLSISFSGQYSGSQLLIELTQGSIYRDAFGNSNGAPPNPAFFGVAPSLEFDTYVAQGNVGSGGPFGDPLPGGGAVDLGGAPGAVWPSNGGTVINQAWNPAGGQVIEDQTDFLVARITVSEFALGTMKWLNSAGGSIEIFETTITGGCFGIWPEPASVSLCFVACLGTLCSRHRRLRNC